MNADETRQIDMVNQVNSLIAEGKHAIHRASASLPPQFIYGLVIIGGKVHMVTSEQHWIDGRLSQVRNVVAVSAAIEVYESPNAFFHFNVKKDQG